MKSIILSALIAIACVSAINMEKQGGCELNHDNKDACEAAKCDW